MDFDYPTLLDKITEGRHFSYSRWGDGEWSCLLGRPGQNCDAHQYFPDMGKRLKAILESGPGYYTGLQNLADRIFTGEAEFERLKAHNQWVPNELLHHASIKGRLQAFFDALEGHHVILVGNSPLAKLDCFTEHITIPISNCWLHYKDIKTTIAQSIKPGCIVLYCASMMTNVLIDDLHQETITQIDCGSVFDPYVGRNTRSYHHKLKI